MPIWVWLFLLVCIAYSSFVLWRAWTKGFVQQGPFRYTRQDDLFTFWFIVVMFCLCEFWFVGMLVLLIVVMIHGPIVDQGKCPSEHGWEKALNCPSVDANGEYVPRGGS